jgi:hypothetical protein
MRCCHRCMVVPAETVLAKKIDPVGDPRRPVVNILLC